MGNETTSRRGGSQPRFTTEKAFLTLRQRELLVADATRLSLPVQEVIRRIIDQHYDENVVARISRIEKRLDQLSPRTGAAADGKPVLVDHDFTAFDETPPSGDPAPRHEPRREP